MKLPLRTLNSDIWNLVVGPHLVKHKVAKEYQKRGPNRRASSKSDSLQQSLALVGYYRLRRAAQTHCATRALITRSQMDMTRRVQNSQIQLSSVDVERKSLKLGPLLGDDAYLDGISRADIALARRDECVLKGRLKVAR